VSGTKTAKLSPPRKKGLSEDLRDFFEGRREKKCPRTKNPLNDASWASTTFLKVVRIPRPLRIEVSLLLIPWGGCHCLAKETRDLLAKSSRDASGGSLTTEKKLSRRTASVRARSGLKKKGREGGATNSSKSEREACSSESR